MITLGAEQFQSLNIFDWTTTSNDPVMTIKIDGSPQFCLKVSPTITNDSYEFMTSGSTNVYFYTTEKDSKDIKQHIPAYGTK